MADGRHGKNTWWTALPATALLVSAIALSQANASECIQEQAVYADVDGLTELVFIPPSGGITTSHGFELRFKSGPVLTGEIIWNMGASRPNGSFALKGCDVSTDNNCSLWDGVVYTISTDGELSLIDAGDQPAADQIVLPDLSRTLYYSGLRETVDSFPWEAFKFARCRTQ